ncbi:MAG: hypothetical protein R3B70_03715 [Polyangiaceae bacterium]
MSELDDKASETGAAKGKATTYRTAPAKRKPLVIETAHLSRRWLAFLWLAATVFLILRSRHVQLVCERDRDGGTCTILEETLLSKEPPRTVPIADLTSARFEKVDDASRILLVTKSGEVPIPSAPSDHRAAEKQALTDEINHFLQTPTQPKLVAEYGSLWSDNIPTWIPLTLLALGLLYVTRRLRVLVDHAEGVVRAERPIFPWGKEVKVWPLSTVARAEVQDGGDSTYRVALILTTGAAEPLTMAYSSGERGKARAAAEINAALADKD